MLPYRQAGHLKHSVNWGGGIGDCVFVIVTGFLYWNKKTKWERILRLWLEVWFYSVILGVFCIGTGISGFSTKAVIKMLFPVIYNEYPFFSAYIVLYLLIPFLNKLCRELTKEQFQWLLMLLLMVISVVPTFMVTSWIMTGTQLPMFIMLFLTGSYLGKYRITGFKKNRWNVILFSFSLIFMWSSSFVFRYVGFSPFYLSWDMNKFPVVGAALFIFFVFLKLDFKLEKAAEWGYYLQTSVFGVYLIHMHRMFKIPLLDRIFDNSSTYGTWLLYPQVILGAIAIFAGCVFIDRVRIEIVERLYMKSVKMVAAKLEAKSGLYININ